MSKPPNNRQNAFQSSRSAGPKSRGEPLINKRYKVWVTDDQGNCEGVEYADTRQELDTKLDELEGRDRFSPYEVDKAHLKSSKRGALASAGFNSDKCRKCGGQMIDGIALKNNKVEMGVPDFAGNTADTYGQTVTAKSDGVPIPCRKCSECGWSVEIDPTQHRAAKRGAAASARSSRG